MLAGLAYSSRSAFPRHYDFRFSQGAFREDEIFDSALSVPGRYIAEVARRMLKAAPDADRLAIGNPLLPLRAGQLATWLEGTAPGPLIATDQSGFPIVYVLPRRAFDEFERFLLLLSVQDAKADCRLFGSILGTDIAQQVLDLPALGGLPPQGSNGWLNGDGRLRALGLQCANAAGIIKMNRDWQRVPFAVYYPMHAGDVLFMAVASRLAQRSFFSKQVVCSSYMDIPEACGSRLEPMRLRLPWISRDGSVSEFTYFGRALERLGDEAVTSNFFVFSRILRLYYRTPFHLVDHARFALGDPLESYEGTIHAIGAEPEHRCRQPVKPLRVLFHLNGGWALKTYPLPYIRTIIGALRHARVDVTVIDRPDLEEAGARSVVSEDSATLRRLVEDHHLFVGVDSFPHHFARLVMGWPTIGLFGNTKPCNSDARYGDTYRTSDLNLSCNRCGAYDVCPSLGRRDCVNYGPAETVVADIFEMAGRLYGYSA